MNLIGFGRRHLENLDRAFRRTADLRRIETVQVAGVTTSYACVEPKEQARVRSLGGERLLQVFLEKHIEQGDIVFDIGANIGFYSVIFAKKVGARGKVFAFEPEPVNFERLRTNADLNKLSNLIPCPFAVSKTSRLMFLKRFSHEAGEGAHHVVEKLGEDTVPVFSFAIDFFVSQFAIPKPTVLKLDIEGHEIEALHGMKETLLSCSIRAAFVEIHYFRQTDSGKREPFQRIEEQKHRQCIIDEMAKSGLTLLEEEEHEEPPLRYAHAIFLKRQT